jgi:hypothetical protein
MSLMMRHSRLGRGSSGFAHRNVRTVLGRSQQSTAVNQSSVEILYGNLNVAYNDHKQAPPSMKFQFSAGILECMQDLKNAGANPKWGAATESLSRRNVFQGELRQVGIKNPDKIAVPSVRNDAAFLATVTVSTSLLAVIAGAVLPGDWGFFTSYLVGGITLGVLAVGSTAPGLLQFAIDKFSQVFPDYRERVVQHEAAHFLLGYLMGVPVTGYGLDIGQEHTEFAEAKIQKRLIERMLEDSEIDQLAVVAVAGIAAEGQKYEEVMGQNADLIDLQRILLRAKNKMSDGQQQNMTRWAVFTAGSLLRQYKKEHEALIGAMSRGAPVIDCVKAIEDVKTA